MVLLLYAQACEKKAIYRKGIQTILQVHNQMHFYFFMQIRRIFMHLHPKYAFTSKCMQYIYVFIHPMLITRDWIYLLKKVSKYPNNYAYKM